jgi:hypothetical protein
MRTSYIPDSVCHRNQPDSCGKGNAPANRGRTRGRGSAVRVSRAAAARARTAISPLAIFTARAEARAILYAACVIDLHSAVDVLQADAEASGLVRDLGQDEVQRLLANAFHSIARGRL